MKRKEYIAQIHPVTGASGVFSPTSLKILLFSFHCSRLFPFHQVLLSLSMAGKLFWSKGPFLMGWCWIQPTYMLFFCRLRSPCTTCILSISEISFFWYNYNVFRISLTLDSIVRWQFITNITFLAQYIYSTYYNSLLCEQNDYTLCSIMLKYTTYS